MSDARKAFIMMMSLMTMLNGEYSKELVDFDFESQDETEESEDTDEQGD